METLKKSPIYNISMCSLENFHTCFLAWIAQNYSKEFLKALIDKEFCENTEIKVNTQVKCSKTIILDLMIEIKENKNKEYIIIENKLKSYPTKEQLLKYQEHFQNEKATYILLSLAPSVDLPSEWRFLNYNDLKQVLLNKFSFENQYHEALVNDYIQVIDSIAKAFPKTLTKNYDFYEKNELDNIGLKDIYIKYRTSEFADYIKRYINKPDYYIGYSFHNKKGTIDIIKHLDEVDSYLGIQIEHNQYRYYLRSLCKDNSKKANEIREKIANYLYAKDYWFNNTLSPNRPTIYKNFCGYNPDFIYRYFQIDQMFNVSGLQNVSYDKIAKKIKSDLDSLEKHQSDIIEIIKEYINKSNF